LHAIHGVKVYDKELCVPRLMVNARLFPTAPKVSTAGQQVDLPVTLFSMLGYPAHWQDKNLFERPRDGRAYFFSPAGSLIRSLLDSILKYIYDSDYERCEICNLSADPHEHFDLAGDPAYPSRAAEGGAGLCTWYDFRNRFLRGFTRGEVSVPAAGDRMRRA